MKQTLKSKLVLEINSESTKQIASDAVSFEDFMPAFRFSAWLVSC